jgi:glycosyltransferase involved in cell wall biosynthesis
MKIVMIGPVYPYKGGISHYTTFMSRALARKHEVANVSYSVQYPKMLYPGDSQKDYGNEGMRIEGARFILNTVNPASYVKTASFIRKSKPDLVIFHWWHPFFAPAYWSVLKLLRKKIKTLFLLHNVLPHEKFPFQKLLAAAVLRRADAFILHSSLDERNLKAIMGGKGGVYPYKKNPHPTYSGFLRSKVTRSEARRLLKIDDAAPTLLFFGFVREYKGLRVLLEAFPKIAEKNGSCKLLVAGSFQKAEKAGYFALIDAINKKTSGGVLAVDAYVPDDEVEKYFAACDLVALPYLSATQSGAAQVAYAFKKPVVATAVGGLPEVVIDGETGYVVPPNDAEALAKAVVAFLDEPDKDKFARNIEREACKYSWDRIVEGVEELHAEITGNESRRR